MTFLIVFARPLSIPAKKGVSSGYSKHGQLPGTMKYRSKVIVLLMAMVFVTTGISIGVLYWYIRASDARPNGKPGAKRRGNDRRVS